MKRLRQVWKKSNAGIITDFPTLQSMLNIDGSLKGATLTEQISEAFGRVSNPFSTQTFESAVYSTTGVEYLKDDPVRKKQLEEERLVFAFIYKYPLPRPANHGWLDKARMHLLGDYEDDLDNIPDFLHSKYVEQLNVQWDVYIHWCYLNVRSQNSPDYVLPNEILKQTVNGKELSNNFPLLGVTEEPVNWWYKILLALPVIHLALDIVYGDDWWVNANLYIATWYHQLTNLLQALWTGVKEGITEGLKDIGWGALAALAVGAVVVGGALGLEKATEKRLA